MRSVLGVLLIGALGLNCSDKKSTDHGTDDGGPSDLPGGAESYVHTSDGDTLTTANGIVLKIGPAALPTDTLVRLVPIDPPSLDGSYIAGARMGPEGLVLDSVVLVRFPLPVDWNAGDTPVVYEFKGNDPLLAVLSWPLPV